MLYLIDDDIKGQNAQRLEADLLTPSPVLPVRAARHPREDLTHRVDVPGKGNLVRWKLIKP